MPVHYPPVKAGWPAPHPLDHESYVSAHSSMMYGPSSQSLPGTRGNDPAYRLAAKLARDALKERNAPRKLLETNPGKPTVLELRRRRPEARRA